MWLLKRRHYDGGESVLQRFDDRDKAENEALAYNLIEQTGAYYVEAYDPKRAERFGWTQGKIDAFLRGRL